MTAPAKVTYEKRGDSWLVYLDGVEVGATRKNDDGWAFYCSVKHPYFWTVLASGEMHRRDAVIEGLTRLRVRHHGRIRLPSEDSAGYWCDVGLRKLDATTDALRDERNEP